MACKMVRMVKRMWRMLRMRNTDVGDDVGQHLRTRVHGHHSMSAIKSRISFQRSYLISFMNNIPTAHLTPESKSRSLQPSSTIHSSSKDRNYEYLIYLPNFLRSDRVAFLLFLYLLK